MIISVSGKAGSGKSTVAKLIRNKLNFKHINIGNIRRDIAKKLNIDIHKLNKLSFSNTKFDTEVDDYQKRLNINDNILLDSRLGFHFQPKSFKVFFDVDDNIAAQRRFNDQTETENYKTIKDALNNIILRNKEDENRYLKLYGITHLNDKNYNLIVDTSNITPQKASEIVIRAYKEFLSK